MFSGPIKRKGSDFETYEYFGCNGDIPKNNFEVKYSNAIVQYLNPTKIPCFLP